MSNRDVKQSNIGILINCQHIDNVENITPEEALKFRSEVVKHGGAAVFRFGRKMTQTELVLMTEKCFGQCAIGPGMVTGIGMGDRVHPDIAKYCSSPTPSINEQVDLWMKHYNRDPHVAVISNKGFAGSFGTSRHDSKNQFAKNVWEWHSDMNYTATPVEFSLLYAEQPTKEGGRTMFCSLLPTYQRILEKYEGNTTRLQKLFSARLKHDSSYASHGVLRPRMTHPKSPREAPGAVHPLFIRVEEYGDMPIIFPGRRKNAFLQSLLPNIDDKQNEEIINNLWDLMIDDEYTFVHKWQVGDVAVMDNRVLLHYREPFPETEIRTMWRTQTVGKKLISAFENRVSPSASRL